MLKAVYLDKDGTLSRRNQKRFDERNRLIAQMSGSESFAFSAEIYAELYKYAEDFAGPFLGINNFDSEMLFYRTMYRRLFEKLTKGNDPGKLAAELMEAFPPYTMSELYPETIEVLDFLKGRGLVIGVISDTGPSLDRALEWLEIKDYFSVVEYSSKYGAWKPDPEVYRAALKGGAVFAEECIYVDDYDVEADGARDLGMTSFHLKRGQAKDLGRWQIDNLHVIIEYITKKYNVAGE